MNYCKIEQCSIAAGPGCAVSLFVSGCDHRCRGCFQSETWNFDYGKEFTEQTVQCIIELAKPSYISHLAILGGDPCHPKNWPAIKELVKTFKEEYPNKDVWLWTGCLWEDIADDLIGSGVDVVVDGQFVEELKDLRLKYRGSSNQRVIDVQASVKNKDIILYD